MAVDYRERKQVTRNRPKRQSLGFVFFFAIGAGLLLSFLLGGASGWLLHQRLAAREAARLAAQLKEAGPPSTGTAPLPVAPSGAPNPDGTVPTPPLTFYKTLPSGGKALIGSGFNPKREGEPDLAKPAPPAVPPAPAAQPPKSASVSAPAAAPAPARETTAPPTRKESDPSTSAAEARKAAEQKTAGEGAPRKSPDTKPLADSTSKKSTEAKPIQEAAGKKPGEAKPTADVGRKSSDGPRTYCVQVSSYKSKTEAEEARAKLAARGLAAYIVVSAVEDKGVWYRVRIGRRLSQAAAMDIASRAGQGAMAIPESGAQ